MKMTPLYKLKFIEEGGPVSSWYDVITDAVNESDEKKSFSFTVTNNPSRTYTIGDKDRPATAADIADVQEQLAQAATNPNLTLVTGVGIFESQKAWEEWRAANMTQVSAPPAPTAPAPSTMQPRPKKTYGYLPKRVIAKHQPGGVKNAPPPSTNIFTKPSFYSPMNTPQNYNIPQHVPIVVQSVLKSFEGTVHGRMEISE